MLRPMKKLVLPVRKETNVFFLKKILHELFPEYDIIQLNVTDGPVLFYLKNGTFLKPASCN